MKLVAVVWLKVFANFGHGMVWYSFAGFLEWDGLQSPNWRGSEVSIAQLLVRIFFLAERWGLVLDGGRTVVVYAMLFLQKFPLIGPNKRL